MSTSDLSFSPLGYADLPLMQRWRSLPHVEAWWRQPSDPAGVAAMYRPRIDGTEPTHVFIIRYSGRSIGWIQWYRWADYSKHALQLGTDLSWVGLDLAIGEVDMLGRGLGTQAIREFTERVIFAEPTITACACDPEEQNIRSIRAFEKAGFVTLRTTQLAEEPYLRRVVLFERQRSKDHGY
jgi:RimJ/RimL family protein N-acetyltransferase